jgi:hypothetical protein
LFNLKTCIVERCEIEVFLFIDIIR